MPILKVLSALLCYPQADMLGALPEMAKIAECGKLLPLREKTALLGFITTLSNADPMALQEDYVALFDRGRYLSLHIFEHVHGESRDRGQAMVDLLQLYHSHGFELAARELPDYIPLFLEFLSQRPAAEALPLLRDALPVLSLIGARLHEKRSAYACLFDALHGLAGEPDNLAEIRGRAAAEAPDAAIERMDEIWEEEAVRFMGNPNACAQPSETPETKTIPPYIPRKQQQPDSI
jgi:nitrate reductase molybdenum cofactor assembly chaperone NarJ/NarW